MRYGSRNCTKLVLKPLAAKTATLFQSCILLLSCRLYNFDLHDDYPPFLYTMQSIYIAALPILMNWNGSNIANLIYWPQTTNLFLKVPVQLLLTHCRIPLQIKNPVVVVVVIFLKHHGLFGRSADSNYFYTQESVPCTNFHVCLMPFMYVSCHVCAHDMHGRNCANNLGRPKVYLKRRPTWMFYCDVSKDFQSSYFFETLKGGFFQIFIIFSKVILMLSN